MKDCRTYAPMLGARPGDLDAEEEARLAAHLGSCPKCQARLADERATEGMLSEALMREAARRDFADFADRVMARIPRDAWRAEPPEGQGALRSLQAFFRRHKALAIASAIAPALAAAAVYLFVDRSTTTGEEAPLVEVVSEGLSPTVLDTNEGPIILVSDSDGT